MRKAICVTLLMLAGCVGSPIHSSLKYSSVKGKAKKNNKALMMLEIGMPKKEVLEVMGDPEQSEAYKWGVVWMYRTAMTSGVYGTADSDFTPVVMENGKVVGWGRNFFMERAKKYEVKVSHSGQSVP